MAHDIIPSQSDIERAQSQSEQLSKRALIHQSVGDANSILGTTTDLTHLLLVELAQLTAAISQATTIKEIKVAAEKTQTVLGGVNTKITNQQLVMPFQQKGLEQVLADVELRANGVTSILKNV